MSRYEDYDDDYEAYEEEEPKRKKKKKKKKKKKSVKRKVLFAILIIFLFLIGFAVGSFFYVFGGLNTTKIASDNESLGISETTTSKSHIQNIALYGVDDRDNTDKGRSDAIMVMSVDTNANTIKMISILRDSKVAVDGYGETKINHAYAYGGPELAVKTLNQNFDLDIKEYVTVNFNQLIDVVDAVGGVDIELTQAEVNSANDLLQYQYPGSTSISGTGVVHLDGKQAVSFARIRHLDSDNARADRQKQVLAAVFNRVTAMSKADYPSFIRQFLSIVETSLDYGDLMALSPVMLKGNLSMEQYSVPDEHENPWGGTDTDGVWYFKYDLNAAADRMHSIIYEDAQ